MYATPFLPRHRACVAQCVAHHSTRPTTAQQQAATHGAVSKAGRLFGEARSATRVYLLARPCCTYDVHCADVNRSDDSTGAGTVHEVGW